MTNYNSKTLKYLESSHRKIADQLIKFEMDNNYSQLEASKILDIKYNDLLKVEFNHPNTSEATYKNVYTALKRKLS